MAKMKYWNGTAWEILDAKDADTVDSKHASATLNTTEKNDLAGAINEVKSTVDAHKSDNTAHVNARHKVNVDFNTLDKTGFYIAEGTSLVNSPTGTASGVFYIEVIEYADGTNHLMQLAYYLYETQHVYRRQKINGTWTAWFDLFQYANDGKTGIANAVTAKGVAASPSDTFATLATKIGQIAQFRKASGQVTSGAPNASASGLSFRPKYVILHNNYVNVILSDSPELNGADFYAYADSTIKFDEVNKPYYGAYGFKHYIEYDRDDYAVFNWRAITANAITDDGFFNVNVGYNFNSSNPINWIAIG